MDDMSFNNLSALRYWGLSLRRCTITTPRRKQSLVDILCTSGSTDLLRGLCEPVYESRTVTAEFDPVGDVRACVDRLLQELEGQHVPIVLPNDYYHYMIGDVHINSAGAFRGDPITITAVCYPWRFLHQQTVINLPASTSATACELRNSGTRAAVPEVVISSDATITCNGTSKTYVAGTYLLPDLQIPGKSSIVIAITGGPVTIQYQEAML